MNDNILKLLLNIGIDIHVDPEYGQVLQNFTLRDAEKFAELIVSECSEFIETPVEGKNYFPGGAELKKHFGVD